MEVNEKVEKLEDTPEEAKGLYKAASKAVENWMALHRGETFDLDLICRQLEIHDSEKRNLIARKLFYEVKHGFLEKSNRLYRYIDNNIVPIDWVNASEGAIIDLKWPQGHETENGGSQDSRFGFDGKVVISAGDIIVVAGVSNMGKTAFILNLLWNNMDLYPCTLMGNEYTASKFKRRVKNMTWNTPLDEDGKPKFELLSRRDNWKDIIRPDNINLIDWISMSGKGEFYNIGAVIEGIQAPLRDGIAVISIQKSESKELGEGGQYSEHLSSVYLLVDFERITVRKVKEWRGENPNRKMYGFTLHDAGTKFHDIREVKRCTRCVGGKYRGVECEDCQGKGFVDVYH